MANWDNLKSAVRAIIKENGNQEITGQLLQQVLLNIVTNVGANATFAGVATPATNPGTPDGPVFYIASESGIYTNFNNFEVSNTVCIFKWSNNTWLSEDTHIFTNSYIDTINQELGELQSDTVIPESKTVFEDVTTGVLYNDGHVDTLYKRGVTDYIEIDKSAKEYKALCYHPTKAFAAVAFYDNDKNFLSFLRDEGVQQEDGRYEYTFTPDKGVYCRMMTSSPSVQAEYSITKNIKLKDKVLELEDAVEHLKEEIGEDIDKKISEATTTAEEAKTLAESASSTSVNAIAKAEDAFNSISVAEESATSARSSATRAEQSAEVARQNASNAEGYASSINSALQQIIGTGSIPEATVVKVAENSAQIDALSEYAIPNSSSKSILVHKSKNLWDGSYDDNKAISLSTGRVTATEACKVTKLIPIKPNTYYYLSNRRVTGAVTAAAYKEDGETPIKLLSAQNNEEYAGGYVVPTIDASTYALNGQFKTPAAARYVRFLIEYRTPVDISKMMLEEVGDEYIPDYTPSPYEPYTEELKINEKYFGEIKVDNTFRVLLLGSSFGMNTIAQFPILANKSGVNCIAANVYKGSLSINTLAQYCQDGVSISDVNWYKKYINGEWVNMGKNTTIKDILKSEKWDVISVQRGAAERTSFTEEMKSSLDTILDYIIKNCDNSPKVVFNSLFAYPYSIATRDTQQQESENIMATANLAKEEYGLDVIPVAPILQNIRNIDEFAEMGVSEKKMLCYDDIHLDPGLGCYVTGCVMYEFLFRHKFKSVLTCNYLPTAEEVGKFWQTTGFTDITERYAKIIRREVAKYFANL